MASVARLMETTQSRHDRKVADAMAYINDGIEAFLYTQRADQLELSEADHAFARQITAGVVWMLTTPGDGVTLKDILARRIKLRVDTASDITKQAMDDLNGRDEEFRDDVLAEFGASFSVDRLANARGATYRARRQRETQREAA